MTHSIDIKLQVELCLKSLETILPFADAAGIETDYDDAYDEWEEIVQALFSSFVLRPVCETSIRWNIEWFHKLGFKIDGTSKAAVLVDVDSRSYIIFDIAKVDGERMNLVLCPLNLLEEHILAGPEDCLNFRVEFLANL
ncbi:hypothetical protein [Salipiger abyssi]|uniref:hypothetical protein n=1 Tax=Salipiger abyssi TaxID=1250539 RepID=UPI0009763CA8|nr:hypothetical protein [Salipiger abyssi]